MHRSRLLYQDPFKIPSQFMCNVGQIVMILNKKPLENC